MILIILTGKMVWLMSIILSLEILDHILYLAEHWPDILQIQKSFFNSGLMTLNVEQYWEPRNYTKH